MGRNSLDEKDMLKTPTATDADNLKTPVNYVANNTFTHQALITPNIPHEGGDRDTMASPQSNQHSSSENSKTPSSLNTTTTTTTSSSSRPNPPDSLGFPLIIRHREPGPGSANDAGSPFALSASSAAANQNAPFGHHQRRPPPIGERSPPSGGTDHPTPRCGGLDRDDAAVGADDSAGSIDLVAETPKAAFMATPTTPETPSTDGDDADTSSKLLPERKKSGGKKQIEEASTIAAAAKTMTMRSNGSVTGSSGSGGRRGSNASGSLFRYNNNNNNPSTTSTAPDTPLRRRGVRVLHLNAAAAPNQKSPSSATQMSTTPSESGGLTDLEYDDYDLQHLNDQPGSYFNPDSYTLELRYDRWTKGGGLGSGVDKGSDLFSSCSPSSSTGQLNEDDVRSAGVKNDNEAATSLSSKNDAGSPTSSCGVDIGDEGGDAPLLPTSAANSSSKQRNNKTKSHRQKGLINDDDDNNDAVSTTSSGFDDGAGFISKDIAARRRLLLPRNKSVLLSLKQTFISDFPSSNSGAEDSKSAVSTPTDQLTSGGVEETSFGGDRNTTITTTTTTTTTTPTK